MGYSVAVPADGVNETKRNQTKMTAFDIANFPFVTEDERDEEGNVPTFFSRCATCEMGGNCRRVTVWYRPESGDPEVWAELEVWDEYDMCDSCRYIAEYGEDLEH